MTEDRSPDSAPTPTEALAAIAASRKTVHDRIAVGGWRYDLTYAGLAALGVGGQALDTPFNLTASMLCVMGMTLLFQHESRRTGLRVTGMSPRHARWVAMVIGLFAAAIMIGIALVRRQSPATDVGVIAVVAAAGAFFAALVGSRVWRRVYRAELGVGE